MITKQRRQSWKLIAWAMASVLGIFVLFAAWAEPATNKDYVFRGPFTELWFLMSGVRYHVNLDCAQRPHTRALVMRAKNPEEASGFLGSRLPACQLSHIRRAEHPWL